MKTSSYVLSILVVAALIAGFYFKYSYSYGNLHGEQLSIFWGATAYVAVVAIGVGRSFVWGLLVGVMTGVVAWRVFSALMPEYQTQMLLACGLVYSLLFLISSAVHENHKEKTSTTIADQSYRIQAGAKALLG
ncbi:MAG: hypothetical protein A2406_00675 [Candidatus Komeilibacteria bacterium RIFOXYC1_FULL_37_11]|uniref:Uncharacterized protein n=1 Tax=Candidatus Komeilibacteria bacterium RIFOXYC1_FULL_37_11 TaxID=1798555 RepID=A0A1G2BXI1_9BACT|nr:MAG: hypothetical protein A2406_00675 [Candidatus Komeilibacteria bacterium RIFOXYC1_FULL_37_11]OGY96002.1 MAG: hypothetical protein A2611_04290 [Candidatus Komeilibacteria bacterium RIFOXYD1_FULL_37_29]